MNKPTTTVILIIMIVLAVMWKSGKLQKVATAITTGGK